jgi:transcription antitermination factor NusG
MTVAGKAWFAMKVFQNRVFDIEAYLQAKDIETYFPVRYEEKTVGGEKKTVRKPVITSLVFFRTFSENLTTIEQDLGSKVALYRFRKSRQVAVIPDREMEIFKMVTSVSNNNWDYVDAEAMTFSPEDKVLVTGGEFEGAEGYIKRIKGNRRLVVAIEGVVAVATAYIPSCYLKKI